MKNKEQTKGRIKAFNDIFAEFITTLYTYFFVSASLILALVIVITLIFKRG